MSDDSNRAAIYSRTWYGDERRVLNFPEGWKVHTLAPPVYPAL
jgi:hypothetical protein